MVRSSRATGLPEANPLGNRGDGPRDSPGLLERGCGFIGSFKSRSHPRRRSARLRTAPRYRAAAHMNTRRFFITGTDTEVGKTVLASLLTRWLVTQGRRVAAFKPICSGGREDARILQEASGGASSLDVVNPWHFAQPTAPLLAARQEHRTVRLQQVLEHIRHHALGADAVVVEGAGGLLSPLGVDFDSRSLLLRLRAVPVIVCPNRLGAVNQARLVLESLPPRTRASAFVTLMGTRRPDQSASTNGQLLTMFHPAERVGALPWLRDWQAPDVLRRSTVRSLLRLIGQFVPRRAS